MIINYWLINIICFWYNKIQKIFYFGHFLFHTYFKNLNGILLKMINLKWHVLKTLFQIDVSQIIILFFFMCADKNAIKFIWTFVLKSVFGQGWPLYFKDIYSGAMLTINSSLLPSRNDFITSSASWSLQFSDQKKI